MVTVVKWCDSYHGGSNSSSNYTGDYRAVIKMMTVMVTVTDESQQLGYYDIFNFPSKCLDRACHNLFKGGVVRLFVTAIQSGGKGLLGRANYMCQ